MSAVASPARGDQASSPLGAVISLTVLLGFVLLASQALVHLYAVSVVNAVTFDAARSVAGAERACHAAGRTGTVSVEALVRERLGGRGGLGADASLTVTCFRGLQDTQVSVQVVSPARSLGLVPWRDAATITRTAVLRTERWR